MSVLTSKRTVSKAQYVNKANEIYVETIRFLTRLSSRYSRLIAEPVAKLAGDLLDECEKANSIYPKGEQKKQLRFVHLTEAKACLRALDVRLAHCYEIMTKNPQGCFSTSEGSTHDSTTAMERLDRMADRLGCLLDDEENLLKAIMSSDANR